MEKSETGVAQLPHFELYVRRVVLGQQQADGFWFVHEAN
jgi:hypothetical protein